MIREPTPLFDGDPAEPEPLPSSYGDPVIDEITNDTLVQGNITLGEVVDQLKLMNVKLERLVLAVERGGGAQQVQSPAAQSVPQGQNAVGPATGGQNTPWALPSQQANPAAQLDVTQLAGYGWTCPIHGSFKVVPPGITKQGPRAGQPYGAFIACTDRNCQERPPR